MSKKSQAANIRSRSARRGIIINDLLHTAKLIDTVDLCYRKRKRGPTWWVRIYDSDTRRYSIRQIGIADDDLDADGERILDYSQAVTRAIEMATGEKPADRNRTVGEAADRYFANAEIEFPRSVYKTKSRYNKHIAPLYAKKRLEKLSERQIRQWHGTLVTESGLSKATANRCLSTLKAICNHARRNKWILATPWAEVRAFKNAESTRMEWIEDPADAKRLLNAADADFRRIMRAALETGARYGELCDLEVHDFLPAQQQVRFRKTKNGYPRTVPLSPSGAAFFDELTVGRPKAQVMLLTVAAEPWKPSMQVRRMSRACDRAKMARVGFHQLRHTYASLLVTAGAPMRYVAELLGHRDMRVTEKHYSHLSPSAIAGIVTEHLPAFGTTKRKVRRL